MSRGVSDLGGELAPWPTADASVATPLLLWLGAGGGIGGLGIAGGGGGGKRHVEKKHFVVGVVEVEWELDGCRK